MDACKHPGCERPKWRARGYCAAHYGRWARGADMDAPIRQPYLSDKERFWNKVTKTDSCWVWNGAKQKGYGIARTDGKSGLAHRLSYQWLKGEIPEGAQLDHMCHNRSCVNPDHLRFADAKANGQNRSGANSNSKSGIRGVYWCNTYGHWIAKGMLNRRPHHIGIFHDIEEAAKAVTEWRAENMPYSIKDKVRSGE